MTDALQEIQSAYEGEEHRPLVSYGRVLAVCDGAVSVLPAAAKLTGRKAPERVSPMDLALMGLFTHPRLTRVAGVTMSAVAISDWLQLAYGRLMKAAK
jgi:hypothetical protein